MLCRKPFVKSGAAFPCGRCDPCLFNKRRMWQHRIMLEALCHREKAFVTLTYEDGKLPMSSWTSSQGLVHVLPTLVPKDLQDWLKRLRERTSTLRLRFYGVGEYGDRTWRPHFHVILFGYPTCRRTRTLRRVETLSRPLAAECCSSCRLLFETWGNGDVDVGEVNKDTAGYVAGYVLKKMTGVGDMRLRGRHPEFARMSNRPGIGNSAMWDVASKLLSGLDDDADVPSALKSFGKAHPLGRYLKDVLRERIGREKGTPSGALEAIAEELRPLREVAFDNSRSFSEVIVEANDGRYQQMAARNDIYKRRKVL